MSLSSNGQRTFKKCPSMLSISGINQDLSDGFKVYRRSIPNRNGCQKLLPTDHEGVNHDALLHSIYSRLDQVHFDPNDCIAFLMIRLKKALSEEASL
jgi:hypothetical protein